MAKLNVKFKDNSIKVIVRKKSLTEIDFISYIAGVLELFSGFSAISFMELFFLFIYWMYKEIFKKKSKFDRKIHPKISHSAWKFESESQKRKKIIKDNKIVKYLKKSEVIRNFSKKNSCGR
jgi:hypothetical protein